MIANEVQQQTCSNNQSTPGFVIIKSYEKAYVNEKVRNNGNDVGRNNPWNEGQKWRNKPFFETRCKK
jgi:hypothetical protein